MRRKGFVIALVLALLIYLVFIRPLFISEEDRIRRGVEEGVEAIEAKDLGECLRRVSLHYKDEYGLTYLGVKRILTQIFQEFDAFEIDLRNLRITILDKGTASAAFNLKMKVSYRGRRVYLLGSEDSSNNVKMSFIKEGGRWKATQVEGVVAHGMGRGLSKVARRCLDNTVSSAARICQKEA